MPENRTRGRVLCIGEVLIDLSEEPGARGKFTAHPGGSPLNVATGVARLGGDVALASPFGADGFGTQIRSFLDHEGIDLTLSPDVTDQSTLAVAVLINGEPQYSFYPAHLPAHAFNIAQQAKMSAFEVIHAGSIGLLEPDIYRLAHELFVETIGLTTLDPNIRLSLIEDLPGYRSRLMTLAGLADLVKVSVEDIQALFPDVTPRAFAEDLLHRGATAIVVTAAADGVTVYTVEGSMHTPVTDTPVVDTTGGGDAVMASLLTRLSTEGLPASLREWLPVLQSAVHVAGVACSRPGGAESMPTLDELPARPALTH